MPVEKQELELTEEQDEVSQRLEVSEKARIEAEKKAARAEGEAEALKLGLRNNPSPAIPSSAPTEEQWRQMEEESGLDRKSLAANAKLSAAVFENLSKPLKDRAEAAEREAKEAREEAKRARSKFSKYDIDKEFYDKNPELSGRRGDIAEFLDMLPEDVKEDPKKYQEALVKAKVYAIGKAKEAIYSRRSGSRTTTQIRNTEVQELAEDSDTPEVDLDLSDLAGDEGAMRTIQSIARMPGGIDLQPVGLPLSEMSIEDAFKKSERSDKRGVAIDERAEWKRGQSRTEKALTKGEKLTRQDA